MVTAATNKIKTNGDISDDESFLVNLDAKVEVASGKLF